MTKRQNENLDNCSKEQLINIIKQMYSNEFSISEILIDASKQHIDNDVALEKIRLHLYNNSFDFSISIPEQIKYFLKIRK